MSTTARDIVWLAVFSVLSIHRSSLALPRRSISQSTHGISPKVEISRGALCGLLHIHSVKRSWGLADIDLLFQVD